MARQRKRSDGSLQKAFTVNGKRYCVYGASASELAEKEAQKRDEVANGKDKRENPTLDDYHDKWTDARRDSIKESTLRCQSFQYANCASVRIQDTGMRLGDMRLAEITVEDIREVQKALKDSGKRTQMTLVMVLKRRHSAGFRHFGGSW